MTDQARKGEIFRELHFGAGAFLLPNPADVGGARLLEGLGFEALATTSGGYAFTTGRRDKTIAREEMMAHIRTIANATDLPVTADLENGYGDSPEEAARTIREAAGAGAVGGSIEDATGLSGADALYEREQAADRIRAAAEAARSLAFPFMLTARAENFIVGQPDLGATIERLQAYQEAGADVLYAPGLKDLEQIATLVRSVDRPVNVLMGLAGTEISRDQLAAVGVRRISIGSGLARTAYGAMLRAGREMIQSGTFTFAEQAVPFADIMEMFPAGDAVDR